MLSQVHYVPLIYVSQSHDVDRIIQKNGNLRLTDLLNVFSPCKNEFILSTFPGKRLKDLRFRFIDHFQFQKIPQSQADLRFQDKIIPEIQQDTNLQKMKNCPDLVLEFPTVDNVEDVETLLSSLSPDATPWYTSFTSELMETFRCEESSQIHCPLICLYVIASTERNPLQALDELMRREKPMRDQYDWKNIMSYYLIIHDEIEGRGHDPGMLMRNITQKYTGSICHILKINSLEVPNENAYDIWTPHPYTLNPLHPDILQLFPPAHPTLGCLLSSQDLTNTRNFVWDFAKQSLVPSLEDRYHILNEPVSAVKKGMKNQLRSWWARKPKEVPFVNMHQSNLAYRYDTIEAQTRLLADTAFLLCEYETAITNYEYVREDYQKDKSYLHLGSVNEMLSICYFLGDNFNQMNNCIKGALKAYLIEGTPVSYRLATRTVVLASDMLTALQEQSQGVNYMNIASEYLLQGSRLDAGIIPPLLLERAAFCDLQGTIPKFRKFAFRLIMAGHMYQALEMSRHAVRCYALARSVYDEAGWQHIEDHVNFILARILDKMGSASDSIPFFLKLVCTGRQTPEQQETFLREFETVVQRHVAMEGKTLPITIDEFGLPEILDEKIQVFSQPNASTNKNEEYGTEPWLKLQHHLNKSLRVEENMKKDSSQSWFTCTHDVKTKMKKEGRLKRKQQQNRGKHLEPSRCFVAGEAIFVTIVMKNVLSCSVELSDVHLYGEFVPIGAEKGVSIDSEQQEHASVTSLTVTLLPQSETQVQLEIKSKEAGQLFIKGIMWCACHRVVRGKHAFYLRGILLQDTREHRALGTRAACRKLEPIIQPSMSWLGVSLKDSSAPGMNLPTLDSSAPGMNLPTIDSSEPEMNLPLVCYVGQLKSFQLFLCNRGKSSITGLYLQHDPEFHFCIQDENSGDVKGTLGASGSCIDLSALKLSPGSVLPLSCYLRCPTSVQQTEHKILRLVFRYDGISKPRWLHFEMKVIIQPCLQVAYFCRPAFQEPGEYIVGITASNITQPEEGIRVQLNQLAALSRKYTTSPLLQDNDDSSQTRYVLQAGQRLTLYFKVCSLPPPFDSVILKLFDRQESTLSSPSLHFACLDNAKTMHENLNILRAAASSSVSAPLGLRSIQSIRRSNQVETDSMSSITTLGKPTEVEGLYTALSDLKLLLMWSVNETTVVGQHHLLSLTIQPPLQENICPLTLTMRYKPTHTFPSTTSVYTVPVEITVRNGSSKTSPNIDFKIEMMAQKENNTSPHIKWAGKTQRTVTDCLPGTQVVMSMTACFESPGIYNLNRFRFTVWNTKNDNEETIPTLYVFPAQYLVAIAQEPTNSTQSKENQPETVGF